MLDGMLRQLEREAGVVAFTSSEQKIDKALFIIHGIYPRYSRSMKSHQSPMTVPQQRFAVWQEDRGKILRELLVI
jgi:hypothetical protein